MAPPLPPVALSSVAAALVSDVRGDPTTVVRDATSDSRAVAEASLFFCVPGERHDGHLFAGDARSVGAAALVVERWLPVDLPQIRVPSVRAAMGPMSSVVFGAPAESLRMVGITGTNGKTTTMHLLDPILRAAGHVTGTIGTTGASVAGEPVMLERTTPEAPDLHRLLARMRDTGVTAVVMEVSSHALAMQRVDGVVFDVALFTNLSQDHLDFHLTMQAYFAAKAHLFTAAHARRGVVNSDDEWAQRFLTLPAIPIVTYAVDRPADLRATDVVADRDGIVFRLGDLVVRSRLRGAFNAWNCLAAIAVARELGIDDASAARAIANVQGVPGRMEPVEAGQDFLVVVDYAHTPDSIRSVLGAARGLTEGRVIVVFGCGGDRDREKRPLMGQAATSVADLSIVTNDNPRSEDPMSIIDAIRPGARSGGGEFVEEPDRAEAIGLAVRRAEPGDVVVIAGKGHEATQSLAGATVPFDDRVVAALALAEVVA